MRVNELYDKYMEIKNKGLSDKDFKKELYAYFDENVKIKDVGVDQIIMNIRNIYSACMTDYKGVERVDYTLLKIALDVSKTSALTDIEFSSGDDAYEEEYRMLFDMSMTDYIQDKEPRIYEKYVSLEITEHDNYQQEHSTSVLFDRFLANTAVSIGNVSTAIINAIENFDPKQLEDAHVLLANMNKSVSDVSNIIRK